MSKMDSMIKTAGVHELKRTRTRRTANGQRHILVGGHFTRGDGKGKVINIPLVGCNGLTQC